MAGETQTSTAVLGASLYQCLPWLFLDGRRVSWKGTGQQTAVLPMFSEGFEERGEDSSGKQSPVSVRMMAVEGQC